MGRPRRPREHTRAGRRDARRRDDRLAAVMFWVVHRGVGHAVRSRFPAIAHCGADGFGGRVVSTDKPSRICGACRRAIADQGVEREVVAANVVATQASFGFGEGEE